MYYDFFSDSTHIKNGALHVGVKINDKKKYILVDTGACENFISPALAAHFKSPITTMKKPITIFVGNGNKIISTEQTIIDLSLGGVVMPTRFVFSVDHPGAPPLVLGVPGIQLFELIIDVCRGMVVSRLNNHRFIKYIEELLNQTHIRKYGVHKFLVEKFGEKYEEPIAEAGAEEEKEISQENYVNVKGTPLPKTNSNSKTSAIAKSKAPGHKDSHSTTEGVVTAPIHKAIVNCAPVEERVIEAVLERKCERERNQNQSGDQQPESEDPREREVVEEAYQMLIAPRLYMHPDLNDLREKFETVYATHFNAALLATALNINEMPFYFDEEIAQHHKIELTELLSRYRSQFCERIEDLRPCKLPPVEIKLKPGAQPVKVGLWKSNLQADEVTMSIMDTLIENGVSRKKAVSPWRSPTFIIDRKLPENMDKTKMSQKELDSKRFRMVHDMREVNKRIQDIAYVLPRIDQVKDRVLGSKYFSKLDARSGYLQLRITEVEAYHMCVCRRIFV